MHNFSPAISVNKVPLNELNSLKKVQRCFNDRSMVKSESVSKGTFRSLNIVAVGLNVPLAITPQSGVIELQCNCDGRKNETLTGVSDDLHTHWYIFYIAIDFIFIGTTLKAFLYEQHIEQLNIL